MPSVNDDQQPKSRDRLWYVLGGCGCGCLFILVILVIGFIGLRATKSVTSTKHGGVLPVSAPNPSTYHFNYPEAAKCMLTLPDGSGKVVYMQVLRPKWSQGRWSGDRAVRLDTKGYKGVECRLISYAASKVKVGVYWYPGRNGSGPYLRLLDDGRESIVDLQRAVSRAVLVVNKRKYAGDLRNDSSYSEEAYSRPFGRAEVYINGKQADDVTDTFGKDQGKYLGSIVENAGKLVFNPAGNGGIGP